MTKIDIGTRIYNITIKLFLLTLFLSLHSYASENDIEHDEDMNTYNSKHLAVGVGIGLVKFNTSLKVSPTQSDRSFYLDIEGDLDLPDISTVNIFYAAYRFNENHSILINYFGVQRSTSALSVDETFGDIITLKANIDIHDKSKFYNLTYGYTLLRNNYGTIVLVAGLNTINLNYSIELDGEMTNDGVPVSKENLFKADIYAPLPLIGLNYKFNYTKKFGISTKVSIVGGQFQNIKAGILQTNINTFYNLTEHIGLRLGLTYFDAGISIDDSDAVYKVDYGYKGLAAGVHFSF